MAQDLRSQDKRIQDETFDKNEIKSNAQRMGQDLHMLDWLYGQLKHDVRALQAQVIPTKEEAVLLSSKAASPVDKTGKTADYSPLRNVGLNNTTIGNDSTL